MSSAFDLIKADLYRHTGKLSTGLLIKNLMFNPGFKYMFWLRLCRSENRLLRSFARLMHKNLSIRYQIQIPKETDVGPGLYLGHGTGIIINSTAKIGANCNLSPFTVVGSNHSKAATIGDNVYIGPHVTIVESVHIANGVEIGAGSVVVKDIPEYGVVVGNPGRVLNQGSVCRYIQNPYLKKEE
ncbi:serine acetyltransferase [Vibrio qinghaiensis]|uniref:Serine acetyltransferase n=1 Tax=Vibrio qinghaiensis TaxID=2025808 RepID=A0A223MWS6_9VIBR|nr:serine O-acetyltransferase [Vibrio qinghaiensis]ASU21777.1 serine acetyltransferase [Vibrio qinghaiensis]